MRSVLQPWRRPLLALAAVVTLFGVAAVAFFAGDAFAVGRHRVERVSPDRLAQAMSADEFYSDFRDATVIVRGTIADLSSMGSMTTITFQTSSTAKAECQTSDEAASIHVGDTVTAVGAAGSAQRLTDGVLLTGCAVLP